jgi:uncharacterized protein (TIGR02147 family)
MAVFIYTDYRLFLRSHFKSLPKAGRGQINKIASYVGMNSTLVSQILSGQKDFTLEQGQLVAEYLGLTDLESDYFLLLLQMERAGNKKLKDYFRKKIVETQEASLEIKNRITTERTLSEQDRAIFYSSWIYSAVRLYCSIGDGKTVDEICEHFHLERSKTLETLSFLTSCNLCMQDGSIYKLGSQKTHLEQGSPYLPRHYANWRLKAIQRSENLEKHELMFTAPFSIHKKDFELLREEFLQIIKKLYSQVETTNPQDVACINIDLFWVK